MNHVADKTFCRTAELTAGAFSAFYEDLCGMFDITALCRPHRTGIGRLADLKVEFPKSISLHHIQCKGELGGRFDLLFDQTGIFVLAGTFVMLPERRVLEHIRSGPNSETTFALPAMKEACDLLAGSWDRVFREATSSHEYFRQEGNLVIEPWSRPQDCFSFLPDEACLHVVCAVKIEPYPEFKCAAVIPTSMLSPVPQQENQMFTISASIDTRAADTPQDAALFGRAEGAPSAAPEEPSTAADVLQEDFYKNVQTDNPYSPPAEGASSMTTDAETTQPDEQQTDGPGGAVTEAAAEEQPAEELQETGPVREAIDELIQSAAASEARSSSEAGELSAGKIMKQAVLWADPEDTVEHVMNKMHQQGAGYVLVGQDGQIQGILSHSDVAAAVSPYLRSMFAHLKRTLDDASLQIRVKWFMSKPVHTVGPSASVEQVSAVMVKYGVRGVPVVDCEGGVLGLVTAFDLLQALTEH